jgi:NHLM bacteriocin system ABC transporter peptidase/ATP-binding protein
LTSDAARPDPAIFEAKPTRDGQRVRTPTLLQMEATECGAACLGIILAHHGRWVPLEELRIACGVSRDGSKAPNILRAGRSYGLHAQGFRKEVVNLTTLRLPVVLFWGFNHFVVLEGIDRRRGHAWINDPAHGPRRVALEELDRNFTGVCLAFLPGPGFAPSGRRPGIVAPLLARLQGCGPALAFLLVASLALVVPGLAIPAFAQVFVDRILAQQQESWLVPVLLGLALTALLRGALAWLQQAQLARLEVVLATNGSAQFIWHLLRLPMEFFAQRSAGDLSFRVAGNTRVAAVLAGQLATSAVGLASMVFYAAVMLTYDVPMTLVAIGVTALNLVALRAVSRAREDGSRRLLAEQGAMVAVSVTGIRLIESLKASGAEDDFFRRWAGVQARYLNAVHALGLQSTLLNCVPPLLTALGTALVLGLGASRVLDGALTLGGIIAFQSIMASFGEPVRGLVQLGSSLQTLPADIARLDDVRRYPAAPAPEASETPAPPLAGHVELRDVTFGYSRLEPPLLDRFSLAIGPGQRVALVGGSGSGKSTVARLVAGLHAPWSGEVRFDGQAVQDIPRARITASVACVDQDIVLFQGSIRENVALWDPLVSDEDALAALRDAALLDMVDARPGRLDAPLAEGGTNLSGGQRQRMEIARALATNPAVLVLDEATSALDPLVEREIDGHLRRRGCTCLIIAHRLSTIRDCDEILVLERGRVVQRGTHEALMATPGPYRDLVKMD